MDVFAVLMRQLNALEQELSHWLASMGTDTPADTAYVPDMNAIQFHLEATLSGNDVIIHRFTLANQQAAAICYLANMVDLAVIDRDILAPLLRASQPSLTEIPMPAANTSRDWSMIIAAILTGSAVVFLETEATAWVFHTEKLPHRSIDRPQTEGAVRGPQEAFNDVLEIQISQLRRRMPSPHLVVEPVAVGRPNVTSVAVAYLNDIAQPALVDAVRARLHRIHAEAVITGAMVASYLRDRPFSIFPTVRNSERVDLVAWQIFNGKVAILVDGDPFALWVPVGLTDFYRTSSDNSSAWYSASFIRVIRWLAWGFGIYLPAIYIALTEVNPDLLPGPLVILTSGSHTGLPFTPIVEVLVMVLIIEILREAALRLPKELATTIGTVGAIVVGTAVVRAGFVSPQIIVIMTLTALSFFSAPSYELNDTWRLVSFGMLLGAFVYGVYGIVLLTLAFTGLMATETSFGVPYLVPCGPLRPIDWGNAVLRLPWLRLTERLTEAEPVDPTWAVTPPGPTSPVSLPTPQDEASS